MQGKNFKIKIVELANGWKPKIVLRGFTGHCTNQGTQKWTYARDTEGAITRFAWSKKCQRYGQSGNPRLVAGRNEFYDYNF